MRAVRSDPKVSSDSVSVMIKTVGIEAKKPVASLSRCKLLKLVLFGFDATQ